jgi:serine/threonine protein kinase
MQRQHLPSGPAEQNINQETVNFTYTRHTARRDSFCRYDAKPGAEMTHIKYKGIGVGSCGAVSIMNPLDCAHTQLAVKTIGYKKPVANVFNQMSNEQILADIHSQYKLASSEAYFNYRMYGVGAIFYEQEGLQTTIYQGNKYIKSIPGCYIALKYFTGMRLTTFNKRLSSAEKYFAFSIAFLKAVKRIHEIFIHCDIKQDNIIVDLDINGLFTVNLIDFGLSKFKNEKINTTNLNLALKPPEYRLNNFIEANENQDVYCIGLILQLFYSMNLFSNSIADKVRYIYQSMLHVKPQDRISLDSALNAMEKCQLLHQAEIEAKINPQKLPQVVVVKPIDNVSVSVVNPQIKVEINTPKDCPAIVETAQTFFGPELRPEGYIDDNVQQEESNKVLNHESIKYSSYDFNFMSEFKKIEPVSQIRFFEKFGIDNVRKILCSPEKILELHACIAEQNKPVFFELLSHKWLDGLNPSYYSVVSLKEFPAFICQLQKNTNSDIFNSTFNIFTSGSKKYIKPNEVKNYVENVNKYHPDNANEMFKVLFVGYLQKYDLKECLSICDSFKEDNNEIYKQLLLVLNQVYRERRQADPRKYYHFFGWYSKADKVKASNELEKQLSSSEVNLKVFDQGALNQGELGQIATRLRGCYR